MATHFMNKIHAGVRELKTHLSAYLERVKAGETITVTEHGNPIGQIVPISDSALQKMKVLRDSGIISWSGQSLKPREPIADVIGGQMISDLLLEDRR